MIFGKLIKNEKKYIIIFFVIYLVIGILIFDDYGISWDEPARRAYGINIFKYIITGNPEHFQKPQHGMIGEGDCGSLFVIILAAIEKIFLLSDSRNIYLVRHLTTFLLFYISVICFYRILQIIFNNWKISLLGCLFLILSPRIFADSFYNPNDIPLLSFFIIATFTMFNYLKNKTIKYAIYHVFSCAALISVKNIGFIIPIITIVFFIIDKILVDKFKLKKSKSLLSLITFIIILPFCIYLFWPTLFYNNPLKVLSRSLNRMTQFPWENTVLYFGNYIKATDLPWHYLPVWISITTPILYLILFLIGCSFFVIALLKLKKNFYSFNKEILIIFLLFFIPFISSIIFRPTDYDGWRHFFFIYPYFIIIAIFGLNSFAKAFNRKKFFKFVNIFLIIICSIQIISTMTFIIKNHPFQNVYFNFIAGKNIKDKFDLDYWGLSYRQALEFIIANDSSEFINIKVDESPGVINSMMLPLKDRKKIRYVENMEDAKYYATFFRWDTKDYLGEKEIYSVDVNNEKIMAVYYLEKNVKDFVNKVYSSFLKKDPNQEELIFWSNRIIASTENIHKFLIHIINQPEFKNSLCSDEYFIDLLYTTLLKREADQDGKENWIDFLKNSSRKDVIYYFTGSEEFIIKFSEYKLTY